MSGAALLPAKGTERRATPRPARASASVLVVDDNAGKRLGVQAMLKPLNLDIVEADSGRAALRAVSSQAFAVILMDVRMPTMDGYETAKLIRQRREAGLTPIVFFTAFGLDETETLTAYANGAVDFIFTPVLADVLRAKVSSFVNLFLKAEELKISLDKITDLNSALHDSEARTQAVLQHVADGIVTADEQGTIESFNRSAQQLFGYREEEIVGQSLDAIVATDPDGMPGAAGWPAHEDLGCNPHGTATFQMVGRRKDGSSFPMQIDASRMQIGDRSLTIVCVHDTTARQQRADDAGRRERTLRREAQRDRAAFEEAPIGSIIVNPRGVILRVNQALCRTLGRSAEELLGSPLAEQFILSEDQHNSASMVAALTEGGAGTQHFEQTFVLREGRVFEGRVVITAIRDEAQNVVQFFAQVEDVTEARRTSRELEQAQFEMLARLAAAAEFRDDDTGQHTRRVGDLSVSLAERLGLPEREVELIRLAAPLHDVGKIAIPDAVLGKPGKLTKEEFDQIKTHTTVGAQMLAGSAFALLEVAEKIALTHHEKWDGSGYPGGLAKDAIPFVGRIVAVADVFDALTHERPYKAAWSVADALAEIRSQAGRHFDPAVVKAFLEVGPGVGIPDSGALVSAPAPAGRGKA